MKGEKYEKKRYIGTEKYERKRDRMRNKAGI
jgi:hypothetical protein